MPSFVPVRFANSWQSASWVKFEQLKFEQSLFNVGDGSLAVPGRHWYPSSFHHFRNLSKSFNIFAFLMPSFLCAAARCPTAEVPCVCWVMWHSIRFYAILCNYMFWKRSDLKSLKESSLKEGPCEAETSTNHSTKNDKGIETVWKSISLLVWGQEIVSMPQDTSCLLQGAQLVLWKLCGFKAKWKSMKKYEQGDLRCVVFQMVCAIFDPWAICTWRFACLMAFWSVQRRARGPQANLNLRSFLPVHFVQTGCSGVPDKNCAVARTALQIR